MKKDAILVLMSTYNGEKYLEEQLNSIENQKLDIKLDILIRDDGSSDSTIEIINNFKNKFNNITLIEGENIGCNSSFFTLFKIAENYKYYAISDQDDIWLPNKLQRGIDELRKMDNNIPLLYGSCSLIMNNNEQIYGCTQKKIRDMRLENTIIQNIIPGHSQIMNDLMIDLLKKDIDYSKIYVYDFWITNLANLYGKIIYSNEPTTKYRVHNSNTVGYGKSKFEWIKERLKRLYKGDGEKIITQIEYFYDLYNEDFTEYEKKEIKKIFTLNNNFFKRIKFFFSSKVYRQKKFETFLFKIAYLFGKYKK